MSNPYLSEIRAFSFGFAPSGWALCNGQTLPINQYQALFALIGTTYGGNGIQNFQLPNLQGRVALSMSGADVMGQVLGEAAHTLLSTELPAHTHTIAANANGTANATNTPGATVVPGSGSSAGPGTPAVSIYDSTPPSTPMRPLGNAGSGQAHQNLMPYTALNYCIAMQGIFPPRN